MKSLTSGIIKEAREQGRFALLETEAKDICREYGIPTTKQRIAKSTIGALKISQDIGFPVVLKIVSPDIIHKTEIGGVILDVKNAKEVRESFAKILDNVRKRKPEASIVGVMVQEAAPKSTEVIVGAVKDPNFGPTIMFGLGGTYVEVLEDIVYRVAPITKKEAEDMVKEIKAYPILSGYRGGKADVNAIIDILLKVSELVTDFPEIREIDLNPIMVYEKGAKTVDARIILSK